MTHPVRRLTPLAHRLLPAVMLLALSGFTTAPECDGPDAQSNSDAVLSIRVSDLRDTAGTVRVSIFATSDGFLKDDSKALARGCIPANADASFSLQFNLKPGRYAVALFHDHNNNGKLDTNFIGIPTEGYGVSNNPKPRFRAPKYKEAVFELPAGGGTSKISLQYL